MTSRKTGTKLSHLSEAEAAAEIGVSLDTMVTMREHKTGPDWFAWGANDGEVRYGKSAIAKWIAAQKICDGFSASWRSMYFERDNGE